MFIFFKSFLLLSLIISAPLALSSDLNLIYVTKDGDKGEIQTGKISNDTSLKNVTYLDGNPGSLPGFNQKNLIGIYKRRQIANTDGKFWRTFGKVGKGCSGTLIGPKHVLTAAHCVFNYDYQIFYPDLSFTPGQNGPDKPFGSYEWNNVYVPKGYIQSNDPRFDFALIELKKSIGTQLGWVKFGYKPDVKAGSEVNITGYPGDKPDGTLWYVKCPALSADSVKGVRYQCDTYGGMSGSGVYQVNRSTLEKFVFGIHTLGLYGQNAGVYITKEVFNLVAHWIKGNVRKNVSQTAVNTTAESINLVFQNSCQIPLKATIAYEDPQTGKLVYTDLKTLNSGARVFAAQVKKTKAYLYASFVDGSPVLKQSPQMVDLHHPKIGNVSFYPINLGSTTTSLVQYIPFCR